MKIKHDKFDYDKRLQNIENNDYRIKFNNLKQIENEKEKELKKYNYLYGEELKREQNEHFNFKFNDKQTNLFEEKKQLELLEHQKQIDNIKRLKDKENRIIIEKLEQEKLRQRKEV